MSTPPPQLSPGERIDERYTVLDTLGHGGFATVYLAEQVHTGQRVAVKVLDVDRDHDPELIRRRFERELRLVGQLHHPHIVRLIDRGTLPGGALFTVYAYVQGETLHDFIRARGPLPWGQVHRLAGQVLDALVAAHDAGVIHRDIKPRNIMVTSTGAHHNALLLDFGLAAIRRDDGRAREDSLSKLGVFMGTPPYAAPEQIKGARPAPEMDLYSWGLVLVEALTGQRVYTGRVAHVVAAQISSDPVPVPDSVRHGPFGTVLEMVLHKDPRRRTRDARAIWRVLEAVKVDREERVVVARDPRTVEHRTDDTTAGDGGGSRLTVGRAAELALLQARWSQASSGVGQAVWISGEAGLGKSHLVRQLRSRVGMLHQPPLECACTPETSHRPREALLEALGSRLRTEVSDTAGRPAVLGWCEAIGVHGESAELLASLLVAEVPLPREVADLSPHARQQAIDDALLDLVAGLAEDAPLLFVIEDMHWADPALVRWLEALVAEVSGLPILLVVTSRVQVAEQSALSGSAFHPVPLAPLELADARRLVELVMGSGVELSAAERIVELADGVPLFVDELARLAVERGLSTDDLDRLGSHATDLPDRVRAVVEARLADAGPARDVLMVASVWGRTADRPRLEALWPGDATALDAGLGVLVERQLVRRTGRRRRPVYRIKHQLIRDAAYSQLRPARQQALHLAAATWLESPAGRIAERVLRPEVVAHHLARAGENVRAASMLATAAHQATDRTAMEAALGHVRTGLDLLQSEAPSEQRDRAELELRAVEAPIWFAKTSYGSRPAEVTLNRGLELSRGLGGTRHDFSLRWGLWVCTTAQSRHEDGLPLAKELLALAEARGDAGLQVEAHLAVGHSMYYLPRLAEGVRHLEAAVAGYDATDHWDHAVRFGQDPMVMASVFAGVMRDLMGEPHLGARHMARAERAAEERDHAMSRAMMMCIRTVHHQVLRESAAALSAAERLIAYSQRARMPYWGSIGRVYAGWARSRLGQPAARELQEAVAAFLATGSANNSPAYLVMLAEAQIADGQLEAARSSLDEAFRRAERCSERRMVAEAYRLRGRYLETDPRAKMASLSAARHLAHQQGARLLELRALMSALDVVTSSHDELVLLSDVTEILEGLHPDAGSPDIVRARARVGLSAASDTLAVSLVDPTHP